MFAKDVGQKCALLIIADGFEEAETLVLLSALRQAGLCIKSVGLTNGLVSGAHGVWLMPDLALADLNRLMHMAAIRLIILPEGRQSLARLEADPRIHRLLRQVVAQHGQVATSSEGLRVPRAAALWVNEPGAADDDHRIPVLLRQPGQSLQSFAQDLIRRLREPLRP